MMSNGGFDDIHQKLLAALERGRVSRCRHDGTVQDRAGGRRGAGRRAARARSTRRSMRCVRRAGASASRRPVRRVVRDVVVGYCSVDRVLRSARASMPNGSRARHCASAPRLIDAVDCRSGAAPVEVPVCYGGEWGPTLPMSRHSPAAQQADVDRAARGTRVPRLHGRIRPRICVHGRSRPAHRARRVDRTPRTACRPGRSRSPAGRPASIRARRPAAGNIIGRTPLKPFDAARAEPFLVQARRLACDSCRSIDARVRA